MHRDFECICGFWESVISVEYTVYQNAFSTQRMWLQLYSLQLVNASHLTWYVFNRSFPRENQPSINGIHICIELLYYWQPLFPMQYQYMRVNWIQSTTTRAISQAATYYQSWLHVILPITPRCVCVCAFVWQGASAFMMSFIKRSMCPK